MSEASPHWEVDGIFFVLPHMPIFGCMYVCHLEVHGRFYGQDLKGNSRLGDIKKTL